MKATRSKIVTALWLAGALVGLLAIMALPGRWIGSDSAQAHTSGPAVEFLDSKSDHGVNCSAQKESPDPDSPIWYGDACPFVDVGGDGDTFEDLSVNYDQDGDGKFDTYLLKSGSHARLAVHVREAFGDAPDGTKVNFSVKEGGVSIIAYSELCGLGYASGEGLGSRTLTASSSGDAEVTALGTLCANKGKLTEVPGTGKTDFVIADTVSDSASFPDVSGSPCDDAEDTCIDGDKPIYNAGSTDFFKLTIDNSAEDGCSTESGGPSFPANVRNSEDDYEQCDDGDSFRLDPADFGIPSDAVIQGIQVRVEQHTDALHTVLRDETCIRLDDDQTFPAGATAEKCKDVDTLGVKADGPDQTDVYGDKDDLWGRTWTVAEVNNLHLQLHVHSPFISSHTVSIDQIQVKIDFKVPKTAGPGDNPDGIAMVNVQCPFHKTKSVVSAKVIIGANTYRDDITILCAGPQEALTILTVSAKREKPQDVIATFKAARDDGAACDGLFSLGLFFDGLFVCPFKGFGGDPDLLAVVTTVDGGGNPVPKQPVICTIVEETNQSRDQAELTPFPTWDDQIIDTYDDTVQLDDVFNLLRADSPYPAGVKVFTVETQSGNKNGTITIRCWVDKNANKAFDADEINNTTQIRIASQPATAVIDGPDKVSAGEFSTYTAQVADKTGESVADLTNCHWSPLDPSPGTNVAFVDDDVTEQVKVTTHTQDGKTEAQLLTAGPGTTTISIVCGDAKDALLVTINPAAGPVVTKGDVDKDGVISVFDALAILRDAAGFESVDFPDNADVDNDGDVDVLDALATLLIVAGG